MYATKTKLLRSKNYWSEMQKSSAPQKQQQHNNKNNNKTNKQKQQQQQNNHHPFALEYSRKMSKQNRLNLNST